jgi:hypothetical protein
LEVVVVPVGIDEVRGSEGCVTSAGDCFEVCLTKGVESGCGEPVGRV